MKRIIGGLLFVADSPLNLTQLAKILETEDRAAVKSALTELQEEYQGMGRAFSLAEVANGYAFRTEPDLANWLRKLRRQQASRLSPAALETLAIVAYKQPVLRAEIERLRGVDAGGTLRMLMEKDLIKVMGRKDLPGRPLIYGTTKRFLEIFGLKNLKDLPTLEEMEALIGEPEPAALEESPQGTLDLGLSDPATLKAANGELIEKDGAAPEQDKDSEQEPDQEAGEDAAPEPNDSEIDQISEASQLEPNPEAAAEASDPEEKQPPAGSQTATEP
jgi:segregation and condensation protein B